MLNTPKVALTERGIMNALLLEVYVIEPATVRLARNIPPGQTVTFGRRETADVCCDFDGSITSIHFEIEHKGDVAEIRDLRSLSGTYLNDRLVKCSTPLRNGDVIRAGGSLFGVRLQEQMPETVHIQTVGD
jgi:pSer/pThr/pTyr-binding forkhead associated (FHA) protein